MKQRISLYELTVGQPLAWDAYDENGVLLLRRGEIVPSLHAAERLIESGLFAQKEELDPRARAAVPEEKPSALQHVVDARRIIPGLFGPAPEHTDDFAARMDKLGLSVRTACDAHAPVCLASIPLMQEPAYSARHPVDVAIVAYLLAKELALDEAAQKAVVAAALTMNLGMYEVQEKIDAICGPLNEKLMSMIRRHPTQSVERLTKFGIEDDKWLVLVKQHHENIDGSGYPEGLCGDAIEMGARIIGLADRYCAMVSAHGHRAPQKPSTALRDLYVKQGHQIDTVVAGTMIRLVGLFPVGTLVRLKTSEVAVVTGPGNSPDHPAVHAVIGRSGARLEVASHRKTHLADFAIEDVLTIDKLSIPIRMASIWGKDAKLN